MKTLTSFLLVLLPFLGLSQTKEYNTKWSMEFQYKNDSAMSPNTSFDSTWLFDVSFKYVINTYNRFVTKYTYSPVGQFDSLGEFHLDPNPKINTSYYEIIDVTDNGYLCEVSNNGLKVAKIHIWFCNNITDYNIDRFITYSDDGQISDEVPSSDDKVLIEEVVYYSDPSVVHSSYSVIQ